MDIKTEIETKKYYIYQTLYNCLEFVKDFAHKHNLILVGGLSLDYAMRLQNKKIYEDWKLPDLDFVSTDYANISYLLFSEIAKYLLGRNLDEISKIPIGVLNAIHHTTMKVIIYRDTIADITYMTEELLVLYELSTLNFNGIKIRHPFFQYVDMQRAFSYPYENPMNEVIFHRWKKDYKRMLEVMEEFSPNDKTLQNQFIEYFVTKSKQSPPNLAKLGTKKLPITANKKKYITTIPTLDRIKLYKDFIGTDKKEILDTGCINGELAYFIYYNIYKLAVGKKYENKFINGQNNYIGTHYFLNSYAITGDDLKTIYLKKPVLYHHQKETNPFMDILPKKIIANEYEFVQLVHKIGYNVIDLSMLNKEYPKVLVKVVSFNFLIMYIASYWMMFKHDMYLSMYLKLLRIINKTYRNDFVQNEYSKYLFPSIQSYGQELDDYKIPDNIKPKSIYINEHITPAKALANIKEFEYTDDYELNGI